MARGRPARRDDPSISTFYLSKEVREQIEQLSTIMGVAKSSVVERAVALFVKDFRAKASSTMEGM